jgi:hypothetical protein
MATYLPTNLGDGYLPTYLGDGYLHALLFQHRVP